MFVTVFQVGRRRAAAAAGGGCPARSGAAAAAAGLTESGRVRLAVRLRLTTVTPRLNCSRQARARAPPVLTASHGGMWPPPAPSRAQATGLGPPGRPQLYYSIQLNKTKAVAA
jgi:hypothetical protein